MTQRECFNQQWIKLLEQVRKMGYGNGDPIQEQEAVIDLLEDNDRRDGDSLIFLNAEPYASGYIQGMADSLDLTITALVDELDESGPPTDGQEK